MNPIIKHVWTSDDLASQGIRGIDDFTPEELTLLQEKVAKWIRQQPPRLRNNRRQSSFVMRPRPTTPA